MAELVTQNIDQRCEFYAELDSDIQQIQSPLLAKTYHSFKYGEGVIHCIMLLISSKRYGPTYQRLCPKSR